MKRNLMNILNVGLIVFLLAFPMSQLQAQQELEEARLWPADMLSNSEVVLRSLDWQLNQKREILNRYKSAKDRIQDKLLQLTNEEEHFTRINSSYLISLNDSARSELAGEVMKQQMHVNLEIAALQQMIQTEENKPAVVDSEKSNEILRESETLLAIKAAESKRNVAAAKLKNTEKLHEKQFASNSEVLQARSDLELAEMELGINTKRLELLQNSGKADRARRLLDLRVELEPLKAQMMYIEELKSRIDDSTRIAKQQLKFDRDRSLLNLDLEMVAKELSQIEREMIELDTLQNLIKKQLEEKKETKEQEPK